MDDIIALRNRLKEDIEELEPGSFVVLKCPATRQLWTIVAFLDMMLNHRSRPGVYISLGKPHINVKRAMEFNNFNTTDLMFIDTVWRLGDTGKSGKKVIFIDGPYKLDLLMDTISRAFKKDEEEVTRISMDRMEFFFMDNLDDVLFYNTPDTIVGFMTNFINVLKRESKIGLLMAHDEKNPVLTRLGDRVDMIIQLDDEW